MGEIDKKSIDKLISEINLLTISPLGRGGSFFFQSLLNLHPEIITLPDITNFHFNEYVNIDDFIKKNESSFDLKKAYYNNIEISNIIDDQIDIRIYKENYLLLTKLRPPVNKKENFIYYYLSFALIYNYDIKKIKYIAIHIHYFGGKEQLIFDYNRYFPKLKISILTKDIKLTYESTSKIFMSRYESFNMDMLLFRIEKNLLEYQSFKKLLLKLPNNIKLIDINLLHKDGEQHMRNYSSWLEIDYNNSMLKSKIGQSEWQGNRSDNRKSNGLDKQFYTIYDLTKNNLTNNQKILINKYFKNILKKFNYSMFEIDTIKDNYTTKTSLLDYFQFKSTLKEYTFKNTLKALLKYDFFRFKILSLKRDIKMIEKIDESFLELELKESIFLCQN
jgi:hypothetical protein